MELGGVMREPCCREGVSGSSVRKMRRTGLRRRWNSATGKAATTARAGEFDLRFWLGERVVVLIDLDRSILPCGRVSCD